VKILFVFLLSLTLGALTAAQPMAVKSRYYLKTNVRSPQEMTRYSQFLQKNGFDVAGSDWKDGSIEVITTPAGVAKLAELGMPGFQKYTSDDFRQGVDSRYLNPEKVEKSLKELHLKYPQFTRLEQIGSSVLGQPIWALLISSTPNVRSQQHLSKPSILFDGLHHAREIMTPEVVLDVGVSTLATLSRGSQRAVDLFSRWNIWIVPMLNVDGSNIVWSKDNYWRKNARSQGSRVFGVDINRNYSFTWNKCNGSSNFNSAQDYRGPTPNSEPETQALISLAQIIRPVAYLSYHSFSEMVLFPYGCRGIFTGENELISRIANEVAQKLPSDSGRGNYTAGTPWQLLYSADGDSMSYMFGEFGAVSFTFEINKAFQPNYNIRNATVQKHRDAWAYFLQRIDKNLLTVRVTDGRSGRATNARIGFTNIPFLNGEKPFQTNQQGYFFKVLDPGQYTIFAQIEDGRQVQKMFDMNGAQTLDIVIP